MNNKDNKAYLWLLIALIATFLCSGKWIIPIMAWIYPVFLVRFLNSQRIFRGYLIVALTSIIPSYFALKGMIPLPIEAFVAAIVIGCFMGTIPYVVYRWITTRIQEFWITFLLPFACISMEWINSTSNPFGTWGSSAYSQMGDLSIMQISSVTGIWGIIFLITWPAAVINWLWERDFLTIQHKKQYLLLFSVIILVISIGNARLIFFPSESNTVKVAGIISSYSKEVRKTLIEPLLIGQGEGIKNIKWDSVIDFGKKSGDELLQQTEKVADSGAKIVLWSEGAIQIKKTDVPSFLEKCSKVAKEKKIYIGVTLLSYLHFKPEDTPDKKMFENKLILITPEGKKAWEYDKAISVPGFEDMMTQKGDGKINYIDTEYGRIGGAICFDMDFQKFLLPTGKDGIDIMLVPGADWKEISPYHTQMASVRGIENGFSLLRVVDNGYSAAYDYHGKMISGMDFFTTENLIFFADIPTKGTKTFYPLVGDFFAYLSIIGMFFFIEIYFLRKKKAERDRD